MKRLILCSIAAVALCAPSIATASGVVLKVQRSTHLVAVTNGTSTVSLVHSAAAAHLDVGQRVVVQARRLRNGTFAASSIRVVGRSHTLHFRGLLLKKTRTRLTLSAGGAVITVNRGAVRKTSSARDTGPLPGTTVAVTATVTTNGELDEDDVVTVSAEHPGGAIEGTLTVGAGTITVVSEHIALVLHVPATFDLTQFKTGDEVLAMFTQGTDGTLTLTALSGDDNAQEADDQGDDQGDDNHGGGGDD